MTELGPLPEEWEVVRLGEVATIKSGGSAPQGERYFVGGKRPFVRVQHLDLNTDYVQRWDLITDEAIQHYRLRKFPAGTIVFPKSGASIRLEKRAVLPMDAYIVSHLCAVLPDRDKTDQWFLFYVLKMKKLAKEKAEGYPVLNLSEIKEILIPLPPLPEQRAIAYVLRSVQEAKEKTQDVINALKELKKSLMKHLFTYGPVPVDKVDGVKLKETEIGRIPEHWKVVRLGEMVKLGHGSVGKLNVDFIPFIPMSFIPEDALFVEQWEIRKLTEVRSGILVRKGDLLLAKITPSLENGKQGILKDLPSEWGYATTEVFPIWIDKKDLLEIIFLAYYLKYPKVLNNLASKMEGTTGRRRLPKHVLRTLPIPLPPLPEQKQIAHILRSVDRKIEAEKKRLEALDKVFKALLNDLMTARRRVPKELVGKLASKTEDLA
ncbi:MAG: restriction endonuclease subunit S [Thermotogae bacterium]|nr:restriction endonuclease subunit S [Thermotogota bacterium]